MKEINFYKYQGTGNDFVLLDNRNNSIKPSADWIKRLCNRRFGVGADGFMMLQNHTDYDFEMFYTNSDGQPSSMCGNGGRCLVAFANYLGIIQHETKFLAVDGEHFAKISEQLVSLQMVDVGDIEIENQAYILNTGSPHYILFLDSDEKLDVVSEGRKIRYSNRFKDKGINVNFVVQKGNSILVHTYERGVEDQTFSCGTGVTAAAIAFAVKNALYGSQTIAVETKGGNLSVQFNRVGENIFKEVFLVGPATQVFNGTITI